MKRLLFFLICLFTNGAMAEPLLNNFYGIYTGSGTQETASGPLFMNLPRGFELEISPLKPNGFRIVWATVKYKGSNPNQLVEKRSEQATDFLPTERPGFYKAAENKDILRGGLTTWARVKGRLLVVYRLVVEDSGIPEMHVYRRMLTAKGLSLHFSAIRDGKEVRTVRGRYRKQ